VITEKTTNRNRTMSLQQRIVCEFFQANPDATRVQCKKSTGLSEKSVSQKVRALLKKGYLAGDRRCCINRCTARRSDVYAQR
jgi:predicted HTH transcriptional regulator